MAIYLYTIESTFSDAYGLCAEQGIRLSEATQSSALQGLKQGAVLELRFPDGTSRRTHLVNYGIGVLQQPDGSLLVESDPCLRFTLPASLAATDVQKGTEIWWLEDEPGMSDEEVARMLASCGPGNQ